MDNKNQNNNDPIFKGIFDTALDAIITINEIGIIQSFNPAAEKLFGYLPKEVINQNITLLMPPPYSKEHDGYLFHYRQTNQRKIIGIGREVEGKRKNGSVFPMHLSVNEAVIDDQRIFVGFARDISNLKTAEANLKRSEEKANAILNTAADGIITINAKGVIQSINAAVTKLFNYQENDLIGKPVNILMPLPYAEEHDKYVSNYLNTGQKKVIGIGREVSAQRKDGSTFPIFLSVSEFKLGDGRYFTGIIRDISDLKETEHELKIRNEQLQAQNWYRQAQLGLFDILRGEKSRQVLCDDIVNYITKITGAAVSSFYLNESGRLQLVSGISIPKNKLKNKTIDFNEGLSGQAAKKKKIIQVKNIQQSELQLETTFSKISLKSIIAIPYSYINEALAVIEIGSREKFSKPIVNFLKETQEGIGISLNMMLNRERLKDLLEETQAQAEELQQQKDELKTVNERLEDKSQALQNQQGEMEQTNLELQEQSKALEERKHELETKNHELENIQRDLNEKAKALESANQYKSEFLANMSHELRTPLNSILILSQLLIDNKDHNLSRDQVDSARTIYSSGNDLLDLINDILDLSKVEANRMEISPDEIHTIELKNNLYDIFEPIAKNNNLTLEISVSETFPKTFISDPMRLEQILKNFLSNGIKFTEKGTVKLSCSTNSSIANQDKPLGDKYLYFEVIDTGIGIPQDKLSFIFDAFNQVDGTTSRQYGGSGLGLTISKKLAQLLHGEIHVSTRLGKGSIFCLQIPREFPQSGTKPAAPTATKIETTYLKKTALEQKTDHPAKESSRLHILLVDDNLSEQKAISQYLLDQPISIKTVNSVKQAINYISDNQVDGIILDLMLKNESGFDLLKALNNFPNLGSPPIIIYTGKELSEQEQQYLADFSHSIILKGEISPKRLLEQIELNFNKNEKNKYPGKILANTTINSISNQIPIILVADDDERNIYSLKKLLSDTSAVTLTAKNGKEACEIYKEYPNITLIIMDMMMPVMDGYDAVKSIRRRNDTVPIIALTAKAMKGDKEKCIEAGCTDYLAKPINPKQLLSLINIWLKK